MPLGALGQIVRDQRVDGGRPVPQIDDIHIGQDGVSMPVARDAVHDSVAAGRQAVREERDGRPRDHIRKLDRGMIARIVECDRLKELPAERLRVEVSPRLRYGGVVFITC